MNSNLNIGNVGYEDFISLLDKEESRQSPKSSNTLPEGLQVFDPIQGEDVLWNDDLTAKEPEQQQKDHNGLLLGWSEN